MPYYRSYWKKQKESEEENRLIENLSKFVVAMLVLSAITLIIRQIIIN